MNYLIDTNVISELISSKPNPKVIKWLHQLPINHTYLSVLTLGEIRRGIEKIKETPRKNKLLFWLEQDLTNMFGERILEISLEVADRWGRLQHQAKRTLPAIDSLLAATALHHDMVLVSRNLADFANCPGLELINPWQQVD